MSESRTANELVAATANRLRMIQMDFADENETTRREYLAEEIERAIGKINPDDRPAFLDELQQRFPTWDAVEVKTQAGGNKSPFDQKELQDWTFLVERLTALKMDEATKQQVTDKLQLAGLAPVSKSGWSRQHEMTLKARMGIQGEGDLDANRCAELTDILFELVNGLDAMVWNAWRQIAPGSLIKRGQPLGKEMSRFATGDPEISRTQLTREISRVRALLAGLTAAIGQVGRKFSSDYHAQFSHAQIEDLVRAEGSKWGNVKVKCWEKYAEISASRDSSAIEREIMTAIADYAESLINGLNK